MRDLYAVCRNTGELMITLLNHSAVEVNERTINSAWAWVQSLQCDPEPGRNVMAALKLALECR